MDGQTGRRADGKTGGNGGTAVRRYDGCPRAPVPLCPCAPVPLMPLDAPRCPLMPLDAS